MASPQMIFINLPVANLKRSMAFYEAIGFKNNPQFTDDTAACMVLSDAIFVMILTHDKWKQFTKKEIPNAKSVAQVMLAITRDAKGDVDTITNNATKAGGKADPNPVQDLGFMYSRSFEDLDGHIWESVWMDTSALPPQA